ncbi:DUF7518 family protein [Halocalculus aciditolerans]|nr:hypothetical protein [Halocalculus aciditolerans]
MSSEVEDERVEELEKRVSEMEATIRGLTEELVDANTRIRKLEEREGMHEPMDRVEHQQVSPDGQPAADEEAPAGGWGEDDDAQRQARSQMEESKGDGAESSKDGDANEEAENEDSDLGDDIIVA